MSTQEENEFPEMDENIRIDLSDIGYLLDQRPRTEFQLQEYHQILLNLKTTLQGMVGSIDHRIDFILGNLPEAEYWTGEPRLDIKDAV